MTNENHRRTIFRLWLLAFAGIVAVLVAPSEVRGAELAARPVLPYASYASLSSKDSRRPVSAFATEAGVYELDLVKKCIRVWPRTPKGGELEACRFKGIDGDGKGVVFSSPKRMAKRPGSNLVAVVDASIANGNFGLTPGVSFYEFAETKDSAGTLTSVTFSFKGRFEHELLRYAEDVAFFPDGALFDFAVAATYENVSSVDGEARQSWIVLGTGIESPALADVFFAVRDKAAYTNAEPSAAWPTSLAVDPEDGSTVWAGSRSMNSALRYDGTGGDYVSEVIRWTWVHELVGGPTGHPGAGSHFEPAVDPNPCGVADFVIGRLDEGGSANGKMGAPGGIHLANTSAGKLLVVADMDNHRVAAFDEFGAERFWLGVQGTGPAEFTNPQGVWVNDDATELVVADTGNGRVQIFSLEGVDLGPDPTVSLSGFTTVSWEDGAETIARTNAVFFLENDATPVTNWLVAAVAWSEDRSFPASISSSVPGAATLVSDTVTIPAGETRAPVVFYALDGSAEGTECTVMVGDLEGSFTISNAPPSLLTGTEGTPTDSLPHSYAYAEGVPAETANADFEVRYAGYTGTALPFHARAFDVDADEPLEYKWRIVGTSSSSLRLVRTYYTNVVETGIPPTRTFVQIPEEDALSFPDGPNGGKLLISTNETLNVATNYFRNISTGQWESRLTTNRWELVVTTNELFAAEFETVNQNPATWARLFFDGTDYDSYIAEDVSLEGADVEFEPQPDILYYFAVLTVTDKDGASVRSIDSAGEVYWCFRSRGEAPSDPAVYSAVFTAITATNLVFEVRVESGDPVPGDTVTLESSTTLVGPDWQPFGDPVDVGTPAASGEDPVIIEISPIEGADARFFRVVFP